MGSVDDGDGVFDGLDDLLHGEGFFEEAVEAFFLEGLAFVVGEVSGHGDDLGHLEVGVHADGFADVAAVDVAEVDVEEDDVGLDFFRGDAGLEAGGGGLDVVGGVLAKEIAEHVDDVGFVVDDEDAGFGEVEHAIEGHVVLAHEAHELGDGDAAVFGAGDAVSAELARIEPLGDGARRDFADACDFAGGQDFFVTRHECLALGLCGSETGALRRWAWRVDRCGCSPMHLPFIGQRGLWVEQ